MNHAQTLTSLASTWVTPVVLTLFAGAYGLVLLEDRLKLRKSIPVLLAAGLTWMMVATAAVPMHLSQHVEAKFLAHLTSFAEVFCFLITAMTFVNTMDDRGVFRWLGQRLMPEGTSWRRLYWTAGGLTFGLSPVLDNLTTALVVGSLVTTLAATHRDVVAVTCISIVVAANAGGAFSPFGDLTTLMVWQSGHISFATALQLFLPALVNWLIPATILSRSLPDGQMENVPGTGTLEPGAWLVTACFGGAIALSVLGHQLLHLPPVAGMMLGLGLLKAASTAHARLTPTWVTPLNEPDDVFTRATDPLDTFRQMERTEWDTLMFFYGVILALGAIESIGLLQRASTVLYGTYGATWTHVAVGLASAVIDNVPVMAAVLGMAPDLSTAQWLLVTLTTGVGGSLLAMGSAAGIGLLGTTRGLYTSRDHLRATWAIALGYAASITLHLLLQHTLV